MVPSFLTRNRKILVLHPLLIIVTLGYTTLDVTANICPQVNSNAFFNQRCCQNEEFSYKHLEKFMPKCVNISPKNVSSTLADCYWNLFDCLLTESLSETQGTAATVTSMEHFFGIMASNFSQPIKSKILSVLKNNETKASSSKSKTSKDYSTQTQNLTTLKKMWSKYYEAENKICQKNEINKSESSTNQKSLDPSTKCGPDYFPSIRIRPLADDKLEACRDSLRQKFKNLNSDDRACIDDACINVARGWTTQDDLLKGPVQYEQIVPKFWPSSATNYALVVQAKTKNGHANPGGSSAEQALKNIQNWAKNQTDSSSVQPEMKGFCTNGHLVRTFVRGLTTAMSEICHGPYRLL